MLQKLKKLRRVIGFENQQLDAINHELSEITALLNSETKRLESFISVQNETFSRPLATEFVMSALTNVKQWSVLTQEKVTAQMTVVSKTEARRNDVLSRLSAQRSRVKGLGLLEEKLERSLQKEIASKASIAATDDFLRKQMGQRK